MTERPELSSNPLQPTFEQVGPRVMQGDVRIDNDQAEQFRQIALLGTKIKELVIDDKNSHIWAKSYATGVLSTPDADYDVADTGAFSKTLAGPDSWRAVINFVRYNKKHADTKIYNIYDVESQSGEVVSAVRRVRIIRNLTRIAFNDETGEPYEDLYSEQRKFFEQPMQPEDIGLAALKVGRIMNRQRVAKMPPNGRLRPMSGYIFTPL